MQSLIVRPATKAFIERFSDMANKPTVRALAGEIDGRVVALGGCALAKGRWYGFIDLLDEARPHKMHIMRGAKRFLEAARHDGIRFIYAEVSQTEPKALAWLTSLGFEYDLRSQHLYRWSARIHA